MIKEEITLKHVATVLVCHFVVKKRSRIALEY